MPLYGPPPRELLDELRRRVEAGEKRDAVASDLGLSEHIVHKYTAHLPYPGGWRETKRLQIIACLDEGLDVRETALKSGVDVRAVVNIIRSLDAARPLPMATPEQLEAARLEQNARLRASRAWRRVRMTPEQREAERVRALAARVARKARAAKRKAAALDGAFRAWVDGPSP